MAKSAAFKQDLFENRPVKKAFLSLAVPTVLSQVMVIAYSLADSFFVGRIGDPDQVAALAISFPIFNMLTALANIFGIGAAGVISRSLGTGDRQQAANASSGAFWSAVFASLFTILAYLCLQEKILFLLGANTATYGYTSDFLFWTVVLGGIPTELSLLFGHLLRSEGRNGAASIGMTLGGVLNILLDPLFIFFLHLEVTGAGLATMLSNTISMLFLFTILLRGRSSSALSLDPRRFPYHGRLLLDIVAVGLPSGLNTFLVNIDNGLMSGLTSAYSNQVIAAYGITQKITTATIHISQGMAQGILPLISYNYAQGNLSRVRETDRFALKTLLIFTICFFICVETAAPLLSQLFIDEPSAALVTTVFLRYWMLCSFGMCLFQMYNAIFQAVGLWKTALLLTICRLGILFPAAAFTLDSCFALKGLMLSQPLSDTLTLLLCMAAYRRVTFLRLRS